MMLMDHSYPGQIFPNCVGQFSKFHGKLSTSLYYGPSMAPEPDQICSINGQLVPNLQNSVKT